MRATGLLATTGNLVLEVSEALPEDWPERGGDCPYGGRAWLAAMRDRLPGRPLSFALRSHGGIAFAMQGAVLEEADAYESFNLRALLLGDPPVFPLEPAVRERRRRLAAAVTPGDWFPNLVLAAPGYDSGAVGREVASSAAACAFLDLAVGWAARQGLKAMAVLYRPPGAGALAAALAASGFARAELTERNLLELPEGGFEGYLTRLPYKRRKEARREVRRLEAAGVRTGPAQLEACAGQVVALRAALVRRYGAYSDESAEAARLQALLRELGPKRLRLFTSRTGGEEVLAFSLWLDWGGSWHVVWFGQRYGHPAARNLYFDAAFYAPVRAAASEGVRRLDLGVAHVEAKRARGCRVVPVDGWFRSLAAGAAEAAMREAASLLAPAGAEGG